MGINISTDPYVVYYENFVDTLEKVDNILSSWINRDLTLMGKIVVVNSLINTIFIHKLLALPSPPQVFFKMYKNRIKEFLWGEKPHAIAYNRLVQDYDKVGLRLQDLQTKDTALKAAWPLRLRKTGDACTWFYHNLPIKDARIWHCNTSPKHVRIDETSFSVTRHIWKAWAQYNFKDILEDEEILNTHVWGNSLITREQKPIFEKRIVQANIDKIIDIYCPVNSRVLTYNEIIQQYGNNISFMDYCSIMAAIPRDWKIRLKYYAYREPLDCPTPLDIPENSKSKPSKRIYWSLIQKNFHTSNSLKYIWQNNLKTEISDDSWNLTFINFLKWVKPTKLRNFQYRLLMNTLTTNVHRHKWRKEISELCTFCNESKEYVIHLLCECRHVRNLWRLLSRLTKQFLKIDHEYTVIEICLNNYKGKKVDIINLFIIVMKQYIYASKCFNEKPNFNDFMTRLARSHNHEKLHAAEIKKSKKIYKKWQDIYW